MAQQRGGLNQGVLAPKFLVAHRDIGSPQAVKQRDVTGRSAGESLRESTGIGSVPSVCVGAEVESFGEFNTSECGGKDHRNARSVQLAEIDASVFNCQGGSHQAPGRQASETPGLEARHNTGGAKRLYKKRSPQSGGCPGGDGTGF